MTDQQFFKIFSIVSLIIVFIAIAIGVLSNIFASYSIHPSKNYQSLNQENEITRTAPAGKINLASNPTIEQTVAVVQERESICDSMEGEFIIHEVKMLNENSSGAMVFEPSFIKINTCDSINFEMVDAGHNAETVAAPDGSMSFNTMYKKSTVIQFDTNGLYLYQCAPHAMMAMAGIIEVGDSNNLDQMKSEIEKFESNVMIPEVKTRMSDLFRQNVN
mgnify:FL=1